MVNAVNQVLPPAQPGDIFALLAPADPVEEERLRLRQQDLQAVVGGRPASPVHLTCQRFEISNPNDFSNFLERMSAWVKETPAIPFITTDIEALLMDDGFNALKWRVELNPQYHRFSEKLLKEVHEVGGRSLLPSDWNSQLVSALYRVDTGRLDQIEVNGFPTPLFTAKKVIVSQYLKRLSYNILGTFRFAD